MWRIIVSFFHVPLHVATHITCFSLPSTRPFFPTHRYDVNAIRQLLPQYMNDAGYTSHMIGKWHLGGHTDAHLPHRRGFETHLGYTFGAETYWTHQVRRDRDGKLSRNTRCVDRLLFSVPAEESISPRLLSMQNDVLTLVHLFCWLFSGRYSDQQARCFCQFETDVAHAES